MPTNPKFVPIDLSKVKTYPLSERPNLVSLAGFADPPRSGTSFGALLTGLPDILKGAELRSLVRGLAEAIQNEKTIAVGIGGHVVKCGLAPVLNDPTVADGIDVSSSAPAIPVDALARHYREDTYIFAVGMRLGETQASFQLTGWEGETLVEVIDEEREIAMVDGRFIDDFSAYDVHLYRIPDP